MEDFRQKAKINLTYSLFLITYYFDYCLSHRAINNNLSYNQNKSYAKYQTQKLCKINIDFFGSIVYNILLSYSNFRRYYHEFV